MCERATPPARTTSAAHSQFNSVLSFVQFPSRIGLQTMPMYLRMLLTISAVSGEIMRRQDLTRFPKWSAQISSHADIELANLSYVESAASVATVVLPKQCKTWGMSTAESCISTCYDVEVERESAQSGQQQTNCGIANAVFSAFVEKEQGVFTAFVAGGAIVGSITTGVGSEITEDEHKRKNKTRKTASNCLQNS